jgi:hypothetical protein
MNYRMTGIAFLVIISSLVALLVVGTEDMGSGHVAFANRAISEHVALTNRGINVQTDTNQDQGCESAGVTSGITNACTATSGRGTATETSTETSVTLTFGSCFTGTFPPFGCNGPVPPNNCNNIGCEVIDCFGGLPPNFSDCTTDNGVQLTSCTASFGSVAVNFAVTVKCTLVHPRTVTTTIPGTGITQSGGISGNDAG